jgi:hypothetical protein
MHDAERLHLPIIQCLANDNSPMFIGPYNTGAVLHGHCGLLSTALTVLWHAVRVTVLLYSTATAVYGLLHGLTFCGMRVLY